MLDGGLVSGKSAQSSKDLNEVERYANMKWLLACGLSMVTPIMAAEHLVKNPSELATALRAVKSGDTVRIAPGIYPAGQFLSGVDQVTIEAADPHQMPHFKGGNEGWHFSRCSHLVVRNLHLSGQSDNGINIDDGGMMDRPVDGVLLDGLLVTDIGPNGNHDAIKCSGLTHLVINHCEISGWGGQAIDLVGCRQSRISNCQITGKQGFSQHTGPQFKGGCDEILLEKCHLIDAGPRPIQAGGSTGLEYFRPPGVKYEARRIVIRDNLIEGGECACAFTGVDGVEFSGNTVRRPQKWLFRILQETTVDGFPPCRNGVIARNAFFFQRSLVHVAINIGPATAPETFQFHQNRWLAEDRPEESKMELPVRETGGIYGMDASIKSSK